MVKCRPFCYFSVFAASLGGFLQSFAACVIAGALLFINREFHLTPAQEGLVAAIILLGALLGSVSAGFLADRFGRRSTLMIAALLYVGSNVPILFVSTFSALVGLRALTGIALGITSLCVPLYLSEISPPKMRGAFVATFQLAVTFGTLVAYWVNLVFAEDGNWRWMLFYTSLFAAFQSIALLFIPETPKWLEGSGRGQMSRAVLKTLYKDPNPLAYQGEKIEKAHWSALFSPLFRKGLTIGVALVVLQQWCGINAVVYFAPKIFQEAGVGSAKNAISVSLLLGGVNCLATALSLVLVDRVGRRTLLLWSQIGVASSLILFTTMFLYPCCSSLAVIFLIAYLVSYAIGLGPIPWVLVSEIYPLIIRARAIAMMTFLSWLSNFLVVFTFPRLLQQWGSFGTFSCYTVIGIASIWCFKRIIFETKGKSLEEIEKALYSKNF